MISKPWRVRHAVSKEKKPIPGLVRRLIKRLTKPSMGFFSLKTAWRTLQGYEIVNMMRKGQVQGVDKGDSPSQATFIAGLFGVIA
jgi:IS6 family transposase